MASKAAIGIIRETAIKRLTRAMERLVEATDVEPVSLPLFRDPAYQEAMQLDTLATWAEGVATAIVGPEQVIEPTIETPPAEGDTLDSMPDDELLTLAEEWGIDLPVEPERGEVIQAIRDSGLLITQPTEPPPADQIADAPLGEVVTSYDDMTIAELRERAEARGIDLEGAKLKADIIQRLIDADIAEAE